jgi:hypothetical protein
MAEAAAPGGDAGAAAPQPATPPPLEFQVKLDNGRGAEATINEVRPDNQRLFVADVPASGIVARDAACTSGQRFQAEPKVPGFLLTEILPCAPRVEFTLYSVQTMNAIINTGDFAMGSGNFQIAQSNYGLAADRIQYSDPERAQKLRGLAATAAGRLLGVDRPLDSTNTRPSVEFSDRVRAFQSEHGLEATGELDSATRDSIGRIQVRGKEIVVPPAAATESSAIAPAAAAAVDAAPAVSSTTLIDPHLRASEALKVPASQDSAAIERASRNRAMTKAGSNK